MKNTLFIDTSSSGQVKVSLKIGDKRIEKSLKQEFGSQVLTKLIDAILKENKISKNKLSSIQVNTGPGSFTGLRVGVSVANALGFALKIPVNDKEFETELQY